MHIWEDRFRWKGVWRGKKAERGDDESNAVAPSQTWCCLIALGVSMD